MDKTLQINTEILKQCRVQMGLSQPDVQKQVKKIIEIENAERQPTPIQLTKLAELYQVPRWVFIGKKLPAEYQYEKKPVFRKFKKSRTFDYPKLRQLISKIEQYRNLFLELREDIDEPIQPFFTPVTPLDSAEKTAIRVKKWLGLKEPLAFDSLRKKLEEQNIFIFMTSKFKGWAQVDKESFRGLSIFYDTLPIIIINDLDYKKARSFTLFHELGHLLKKNMAINCETIKNKEERWCDEFAGCVLMPSKPELNNISLKNLKDLKKIAKSFKISPYACLVRLKQLKLITQKEYKDLEKQIKKEYEDLRVKLRNSSNRIPRDRSKEIRNQFGNPFIKTIIHVLNNRELTLHKAGKILGVKQPSQLLKLGS